MCLDSVFELQCCESLMIKNLTNFAPIKAEVRMCEMDSTNDSNKNEEPWVIALSLSLKGIIAKFIAIW